MKLNYQQGSPHALMYFRSLLFWVSVLLPSIALSGNFTYQFEEMEEDRDAAYRQAVISATTEALGNLVRDEMWNDNLLQCMEDWIDNDLRRNYKPLVKRVEFSLDKKMKRGHALEGTLWLQMGKLNYWLKKETNNPQCLPVVESQPTIYIAETDSEDPTFQKRHKKVQMAIRQVFSANRFEFLDHSRRNRAEFQLSFEDIEMESKGPVKTLAVSGNFTDNRVDNEIFTSFNSAMSDAIRTTETDLDVRLYNKLATDILAHIRERTSQEITEFKDINVAYLSSQIDFAAEQAVLNRVADEFRLSNEFLRRTDTLRKTELDDGRVELSIRIPARYRFSLTRDNTQRLYDIAQQELNFQVAASRYSDWGTRVTIFDKGTQVVDWEKTLRGYLEKGKLVLPEGRSAMSLIRTRLRANPNEEKTLGYRDEIVTRLAQRGLFKLGQGALASANADITLADSINEGRPNGVLDGAKQQLAAAIQAARPNQPGGSTASSQPVRQTPPTVLFPSLESWTRAIGVVAAPATQPQQEPEIIGLAADVDGVKKVKVNGNIITFRDADAALSAKLSVSGAKTQAFAIPRDVSTSRKTITVEVTDTKNQTTTRTLTYQGTAYVVNKGGQTPVSEKVLEEGEMALKGTYHALIIANWEYQYVSELATPKRDADILKQVLLDHYNFSKEHIYTLYNGTRDQMRVAIDRLQDVVKPNDNVLIYYAGHGFQSKSHGGTGYWIPVDGKDPSIEGHRTTWIENHYVSDYVEKVKASHVLLISDSCYSGTFAQRGEEGMDFMATPEFIKRKAGKVSRRAITSGDIEPVADNGGDGHSIFAYHLLRQLRDNKEPFLTSDQLYSMIKPAVIEGSPVPQTPQFFPMADNDKGGAFVFIKKSI